MSEPRPTDDANTSLTLLQRLRANDGRAWERLVFLYGPLLRHWAARRGVTGPDADDVAQEVLQEVARRIGDFRRDRPGDSFRGWLHGVTRNVLLRHGERAGRQPHGAGGTAAMEHLAELPAEDESPDPPEEVSALYRRGLALVKGEFEEKTWQMFWRHVVDGRSPAEVATEQGVSAAAVRQAKSRVLRRLREELGELADG